MTRRSIFTFVAIFVLGGALSTCKEPTAGPEPGFLELRLTSPNIDDGGLFFTVYGAQIDSVTSSLPVIASHAVSDSLWQVVVGGNISTGVVAKIWVPDTRAVNDYRGSVLQAVVRTTNAQRSPAGYAIVAATQ